ncbi:MAG: fumarylacetoacetate hydrolase family protein [Luteolibacter sp.]
MKLIRHGAPGAEKPGILTEDGRRIDASAHVSDFNEAFFAGDGLARLCGWVAEGYPGGVEIPGDARLGPPVARPSKIVCVGQNYLAHAREFGEPIPSEPALFMKASSAWCGPFDDVIIPRESEKLDYEVELAFVIGKRASCVDAAAALDHIAGYAVFCDYSERAFQKEMGGQWMKGKSADTFAPCGPWLQTSDEVADPNNLSLWTKVNGEIRQDSNTSDMLANVPQIVAYISRFMTLLPGDVVATGTPSGVGMGMRPPQFLKPGDIVECGIEGLGAIRQTVVAIT